MEVEVLAGALGHHLHPFLPAPPPLPLDAAQAALGEVGRDEGMHAQLQAGAARAGDEATRIGMLRDVALNREIVAAWEAARARGVR